MTALRLRVPVGNPRPAAHAKGVIASSIIRLVVPYLDAAGDLTDLSRNWVEQSRPARKPITRPGADRLARMRLTATFADPADTQISVEAALFALRNLARNAEPVVVTFGPGAAAYSSSGRWAIRDLSIRVLARRHYDNAVTRAEATIDLVEANIPGWVAPPSTRARTWGIGGAGEGRPRTWVVRPGDRLWSIAVAVYGDGRGWRDLADANALAAPHRLEPGTVLLIP